MSFSIDELLKEQSAQAHFLHEQYLNAQFVRLLKTIGFNKNYVKAEGPYLYDEEGNRYLDLLSGFGVFAMGRNHPTVIQAIKEVLDLSLPNLIQMDCSLLAGLLAKELVSYMPEGLEKVFFCNSGAEAVEAAIKFSRAATKREKIIYCDHAFHGLTYGALSLNGDPIFREGFGPFLGNCVSVPFNDLEALEKALALKDAACFIVEPIQGKGVHLPQENYLSEVATLCKKYGTLLVIDEVQTGIGRTGKFLALEHWKVEPDIITLAKALSGGQIPIGALLTKKQVFEKVFNRLDKAVVHGSTFSKNNCAMAAGLATLHLLKEEKLIQKCFDSGERLKKFFEGLVKKYEFLKEVRGLGLMLGLEFGPPKSLSLKAAWKLLEKANKGLFCQMITIPLFKEHRILSQVAGHDSYVVKLLPPFVISDADMIWIEKAFDAVIAASHRFPGAVWDLASTLVGHAFSKDKTSLSSHV